MQAFTAQDYRDLFLAVQPRGLALPTDPESDWAKLLLALGDEFANIDARAVDQIEEIDPRTTTKWLPNWEALLDLPDPCVSAPQTTEERRQAVVGRLVASAGGASVGYLQSVAIGLGYPDVTFTRYHTHDVSSDAAEPLYGDAFLWAGLIYTGATQADSVRLECFFDRIQHEHWTFIYEYL